MRQFAKAHDGNRTHDLFLTKEVLYRSSYVGTTASTVRWSGKRDSNPRPRAWKARALPTELFPLSCPYPSKVVERGGFEPPKASAGRFTVCSLWPLGNLSANSTGPS